jgi:hypothetical protein
MSQTRGVSLDPRTHKALWRTRTVDPLLTMEVPRRHVRTRVITRDTFLPVNQANEVSKMRREASRVLLLMCPFGVPAPLTRLTTAPPGPEVAAFLSRTGKTSLPVVVG